ncbi:hypothetical protein [Streptomyces halstedii]|uniref:hypothetical protein n=1 Tax=Streptomyces halstedii TaxID=1944 RepID=UPI0037FD0731
MSRRVAASEQFPQFELRWGGVHVTVQRVPAWLITLMTTAGSAAAAWWAGH